MKYPTSNGLFQGLLRRLFDTNQIDKINITASGVYSPAPERVPENVVNFNSSDFWTSETNTSFGQWIQIELKDRFLGISDYAIGYNNVDFPMSWTFTASIDGFNWRTIHSIMDSVMLKDKEGTIFHTPSGYFRFFKWINQGYCNDEKPNSRFYIRYIDLYGSVIYCHDDCSILPLIYFSCWINYGNILFGIISTLSTALLC